MWKLRHTQTHTLFSPASLDWRGSLRRLLPFLRPVWMVVQQPNWNFCSGPPCVALTERRHPRAHPVFYRIAPHRRRRFQSQEGALKPQKVAKKNDVFNIILRSEMELIGRVATVVWRRHSEDGEGSVGFGVDVSLFQKSSCSLIFDIFASL